MSMTAHYRVDLQANRRVFRARWARRGYVMQLNLFRCRSLPAAEKAAQVVLDCLHLLREPP